MRPRSRHGWRRRSTTPRSPRSATTARAMGEGGSIAFMGMLGDRFPDAQFVVTGVLGPGATPTVPTSSSTSRRPASSQP